MSGKWIQAVGIYNRADMSGEFVGIQPARESDAPLQRPDSPVIVAVETEAGQRLADIPITPDFGSCDDVVDEGTFQVFFELPEGASVLRLLHEGQELAIYRAQLSSPATAEGFGLGPRSGHSVPLTHSGLADRNSTYTLQAREKGSSVWQTLDIGLVQPDEGEVDLNQFPGAQAIEVRVLKSSGFETQEVDRTEINPSE